MNIFPDNRRSQTRTRTLDVGSPLPRTDALKVSDIKAQWRKTDAAPPSRFYTMIKELMQVLEGDLSVKLTIPEGEMGVLAAVCNALIEKLILFSRWTLYSAEQTHSTSRVILDHAFSRAQVAENQIHQIANVIGTLEGVITSTRRLSSMPQSGVMSEIEKREHLEETAHVLSENADTIEACISSLHSVAQALYASTIQVLQTTEDIGKLIEVSEDWKRSIAGLHLPEEEQEAAETEWML